MTSIFPSSQAAAWCAEQRAQGRKIVWTNGCFDVLHAGHVELLQHARAFGDCLLVGINSDASVRRLKGNSRPINDEQSRAFVLNALACVDAVCIYEDDTPIRVLETVRPDVHVKGGDYKIADLPEAATVHKYGGKIEIVPLRHGFSTTNTLKKLSQSATESDVETRALIVIPARYGATRFPGKPLANLGNRSVIEHVVARALETQAARPILVATDDARIARKIAENFAPENVRVVMTGECETGTDRIAQAVFEYSSERKFAPEDRLIVVNVQGDEPFVSAAHLDELIATMRENPALQMATLATPINDETQIADENVVKVVCDGNGDALYFSRLPIPFERDAKSAAKNQSSTRNAKLRHVGVYAYDAKWLAEMALLPPSLLEQSEKLEQLRALERGVKIKVVVVGNVVNIAIDTPADLVAAQKYLKEN